MSLLSTTGAAQLLGVSGATVRNWSRAGHLTPVSTHPIIFNRADVENLKERIRTNRFNRLRKRANKSASDKFENPDIHDVKITADMAAITRHVTDNNLDPAATVYSAALHLLEAEGEATLPKTGGTHDFSRIEWKREGVRKVMREWLDRPGAPAEAAPATVLSTFTAWQHCEDRPGRL